MELIWAREAERDLFAIADEMNAIQTGLDDVILDRIAEAPLALLDHPYLGQAVSSNDLRKWLVRKTPFILLYRVRPNAVEVARVVPAASDWLATS